MKIINRRSASAFTHLCTVHIIMGSYNNNINNRNRRRKKRRRHKRKIKWWLLIVELLVLFMAIGIIVLLCSSNSKAKVVSAFTKCSLGRSILSCAGRDDYNKNVLNSDFNRNNIKSSKSALKSEDYINIALFGIDPRDGEFDATTHTDSIIVVTVNNKTNKITLTSVYRDTLLRMTDSKGEVVLSKANNAYFYGGPEEAINTLNSNLDLNIKDYAVVNFSGLATIIDALGGIDANITDMEKFHLNNYLVETREVTGMDSPDVKKSGNVHLNGLQATAFCRIRYSEFTAPDGTVYKDDYGRTARQRFVMTQLFNLAKTAGPDKMISTAKKLLENGTKDGNKIMETSLSWDTILDLIPIAMECSLGDTQGFPYETYTPDKGYAYYGYVVPVGLEDNVKKLHETLFPGANYEPSSALRSISNEIIDETDVKPDSYDDSSDDSDNSDDSYNNSDGNQDDSYNNSDDYDNSDYNNDSNSDDVYTDD